MDVPKLTQTRFAVQQGVASLSRKTANAELNLEQELELAQEPEQELELAQEPELDPRNNIQELGLHLLQLLMARTLRIAPTLTALGVRIARTQDTLTAHGAITAPGALVQEERGPQRLSDHLHRAQTNMDRQKRILDSRKSIAPVMELVIITTTGQIWTAAVVCSLTVTTTARIMENTVATLPHIELVALV
jgi:hypothetical protein